MTGPLPNRRGYALMLTMIFVVFFGAVLGIAWRQIASALRVEQFGEMRRQCDRGTLQAAAAAMKVLESRLRWDSAAGAVKLADSDSAAFAYKKSVLDDQGNVRWYSITMSRTATSGTVSGNVTTDWTINVTSESTEPAYSELPNPSP
ncbi:MAG: hypothetical protein ABFC77_01970 [Thermoguttaceae bacterium]